jgi:hypothetical protein
MTLKNFLSLKLYSSPYKRSSAFTRSYSSFNMTETCYLHNKKIMECKNMIEIYNKKISLFKSKIKGLNLKIAECEAGLQLSPSSKVVAYAKRHHKVINNKLRANVSSNKDNTKTKIKPTVELTPNVKANIKTISKPSSNVKGKEILTKDDLDYLFNYINKTELYYYKFYSYRHRLVLIKSKYPNIRRKEVIRLNKILIKL